MPDQINDGVDPNEILRLWNQNNQIIMPINENPIAVQNQEVPPEPMMWGPIDRNPNPWVPLEEMQQRAQQRIRVIGNQAGIDVVQEAYNPLEAMRKKIKTQKEAELGKRREEALVEGYVIGDCRICPEKLYIEVLGNNWKWEKIAMYRGVDAHNNLATPKPDTDLLVRKKIWQDLDYSIGDKRKILEADLEMSYKWKWELVETETVGARGNKKVIKQKLGARLEYLQEFLSTEEAELRKRVEELDGEEEAIVNINELAQHYATIELSLNPSFVIGDNCELFEKCCTKHLEIIKKFKRNTDG